jgi:hypothetical protein
MTGRARQTDPTAAGRLIVVNGEADRQLIFIRVRDETELLEIAAERFASVFGPQLEKPIERHHHGALVFVPELLTPLGRPALIQPVWSLPE